MTWIFGHIFFYVYLKDGNIDHKECLETCFRLYNKLFEIYRNEAQVPQSVQMSKRQHLQFIYNPFFNLPFNELSINDLYSLQINT